MQRRVFTLEENTKYILLNAKYIILVNLERSMENAFYTQAAIIKYHRLGG